MKELKETAELMVSENYKDRFKAECYQTKIRYEKLKKFNNKIKAAKINWMHEPKHDCPDNLLEEQQALMCRYLDILELRAEIEGIDLEW